MSSSPAPARPGLAATVALYTLARVGMVAAIAMLLVLAGVPLVLAVLVGLIVALPLSMVAFRGLRARLDEALGSALERRSAQREALRARLRGDVGEAPAVTVGKDRAEDDPPAGVEPGSRESGEPAPDQADRGQQ
jgi:hypothetical protein